MKIIRIANLAVLSVLLGLAVSGYAQQEQRDDKQGHSEQQSKPEG